MLWCRKGFMISCLLKWLLLATSSKVWRWDTLVSMIVKMGMNCLTNFLSTCPMLVYVNGVQKVTVNTGVKKAR